MTTVQVEITSVAQPGPQECGRELRMIVAGHAGYGEKGRDIVCAAESILVQALACTLAKFDRSVLYDFAVEGVAGSGCVGITAIPTPAGWERVRGAFESACMGFCLLSDAYPQNVRVRFRPRMPAEDAGKEQKDA